MARRDGLADPETTINEPVWAIKRPDRNGVFRMKTKLISLSLFACVVGAVAFAQVSSTGTAQAGGSARAGASSSQSSGNGAVNGTIQGHKVFVAEYVMRSSSGSSTDEVQKTIKDHESYALLMVNKYTFLLAGQLLEDGNRMIAFTAKDATTAKQIAEMAPLAKSGLCTVKLRELKVSAVKMGGGQQAVEANPDALEAAPGTR